MPQLKTKFPAPYCPRCNTKLDGYTHPTDPDQQPKPHDWSICLECRALLVYTDTMQLRAATEGEFDMFMAHNPDAEELLKAGMLVDTFHEIRKQKAH